MARISRWERFNFVVTNRIPRRTLTRFIGWFCRIEQPVVRDLSLAAFRLFAGDLELHEARKRRFRSLHDCFVRELKEGARPLHPDPAVLVSPCDAVVGVVGAIGGELIQAKGRAYMLEELVQDPELARRHAGGRYVTLRLRAGMYHRFHAPHDCRVHQVTYIPGDVFNVNPATLNRIPRVFCRNERVVLQTRLEATGDLVTLVAVGAVLVASVQLHFLDMPLHLRYRGPDIIACDARFRKGDELGFFQHGSTIIVLAPPGLELCPNVVEGALIRVGQPLLRLP